MDYEKKYRDLVEAVKELQETNPSDEGIQKWVEYDITEELKESEDEKIKKELIAMVKLSCTNGNDADKKIAWLEKQGEQKPTIEMKSAEESLGINSDTYNKIVDECIYGEQNSANWIQELEDKLANATPKQLAEWKEKYFKEEPAWSEEDELSCFESALFTAFSDAWQEYLSGKEVNIAKWAREHSAELLEVAREQKPVDKVEPKFKV